MDEKRVNRKKKKYSSLRDNKSRETRSLIEELTIANEKLPKKCETEG